MKVGAASRLIDIPVGGELNAYAASRGRPTTASLDPLSVRALVAEGDDGTTVALTVADLLHVDDGVQRLASSRISKTTGIPRERLQLAGTHTHSGPLVRSGSDEEQMVADWIAEAVEEAWRSRRSARMAVGHSRAPGIAASRRPNGGPADDRVVVARFDDEKGLPIATLVNFGCHPTTLASDNTAYSADYPGVLRRELESAVGGCVIFSVGAEGDVNPGGYSPEASMIGRVAPWRTYDSVERYGRQLAGVAESVHASLEPRPDPAVWGCSAVFELPRKRLPAASLARAAAEAAAAASKAIAAAGIGGDTAFHADLASTYASIVATQASDPGVPLGVPIRISALGIGRLLHVGIQGEPFVELGRRLRAALDNETTCIAALCDGSVGYIPTESAFGEGGYEPNASVLEPGGGERLVDLAIEFVNAQRYPNRGGLSA